MDALAAAAGSVLFEHGTDGCAVLELGPDAQVRVAAVNPALAGIAGVDRAELVGAPASALYPPARDGDVEAWFRAVVDRNESSSHDVTRDPGTGRAVLELTLLPLGGGRVLACERDVSVERIAVRRIHELEALTDTGTWSWEPGGPLRGSDNFLRIHGLPTGSTPRPADVLDLVHPDDRARVDEAVEQARAGPGSREVWYRIVRADGAVRYVCGRGRVERGADGAIVRATGTVQDISRHRDLERREQALERALSERVRAFELNDAVIQCLARAWLALDLDRPQDALVAVEEGMAQVQQIMGALFAATRRGGQRLRPGDLARPPAVNVGGVW